MSGLFGKKKPVPPDSTAWAPVAGKVAAILWHLMQSDPKVLAGPDARIALTDDWNVGFAADKRDPDTLLGANDVCYVFLREDPAALGNWVSDLKSSTSPVFQQIATEEYAKSLVRVLMANVQIVDWPPREVLSVIARRVTQHEENIYIQSRSRDLRVHA